MEEIVVIGKIEAPAVGTTWAPLPMAPGGEGNPENHPFIRNQREGANFVAKVVVKDTDIPEEQIVVTAQKFRTTVGQMFAASTSGASSRPKFVVPCFGVIVPEVFKFLASLRFKLVTKDFGPGRAGENLSTGGSTAPVNINVTKFNNYINWYGEGGAAYLLAHEMAHTFDVMRKFNEAKFNIFWKGPGKGLTKEQAYAKFPSDPGFAEVESRANTIGRAIYDWMKPGADFGFTPEHGFATC